MKDETATGYAARFARLRTDKSLSRWPDATSNRAPQKPLLLLSVLDLFEQGEVGSNLVVLDPGLGELFGRYWTRALPFDRRGNLALPFFHLRSEGFWHLVPKRGKGDALSSASQIRSLSRLREVVIGARLDEALYELLRRESSRNLLRSVLVETYFAPDVRGLLVEHAAVNREAFLYSKELLERGARGVGEGHAREAYRPVARDQGFRRAVILAYAHRCAPCAIRVRTLDGHTAVDAAHIVPWSIGRDDRPANGMALCRTCHWTFDEGLLMVSPSYEILASAQLRVIDNLPGYLATLEGRGIVRPAEQAFWPDPASLDWHRERVFRRN